MVTVTAKKSGTGEDLQTHAHSLLGLLPAFCRYPIDTQKKFGSLAKLLIKFLKKIAFMHEDISVALQVWTFSRVSRTLIILSILVAL